MLTEEVSRILIAFNMVETNDSSSNGFPHSMEGQCIVSLMELSMWDSRTVDR